MPRLLLNLLGEFELRTNAGRPIDVGPKKARALLAFLALGPKRGQSRAKAAAVLWENSSDTDSRSSLRTALSTIRRTMPQSGKNAVMATTEWVGLREATIGVDAVEFQELAASAALEDRERSIALYRGDLLDGFYVKAPAFNRWLQAEQQRLRELASTTMTALALHHIAVGASEKALDVGRKLVALDPLREEAHRTMMRVYAAIGQPADALRQYLICRERLHDQFGVQPDPETERLYNEIRDQRHLLQGQTRQTAN